LFFFFSPAQTPLKPQTLNCGSVNYTPDSFYGLRFSPPPSPLGDIGVFTIKNIIFDPCRVVLPLRRIPYPGPAETQNKPSARPLNSLQFNDFTPSGTGLRCGVVGMTNATHKRDHVSSHQLLDSMCCRSVARSPTLIIHAH
jgi:hypothetical protein